MFISSRSLSNDLKKKVPKKRKIERLRGKNEGFCLGILNFAGSENNFVGPAK